MKHTPGPWTVRKNDRPFYASINGAYFIRGPLDEYVARLTDESGDREANARLIAAAPELLDIVRTFYSYIGTMKTSGLIAGEPWMEEIRPLLTRINGAEGDGV